MNQKFKTNPCVQMRKKEKEEKKLILDLSLIHSAPVVDVVQVTLHEHFKINTFHYKDHEVLVKYSF